MPLGRIYTPDPVSNHPLNDGLVVWLAGLPEISGGNTLYDIARHARGQLLGSPSWNGDDNTLAGINLSGYTTSQYGIIPYTATPSLSVAAWAYFNAFTASGQTGAATVVDNWGNAPGAFLLLAGPPSPGQLQTAVNTGSQSPWITDPYVMSTGQWYHVGLTIQDGGQLKLFRDGAKVASYTLPNTITLGRPNLGYGVKLNDSGTAYSSDGYPFFLDGKLRDLRVHNRALSESEYFAQYDQALRNHPDTLNRLSSRSRVLFLGGSGTNSYTLDVATATLSLTAEPVTSLKIAMGMAVAQASLALTAEPITSLQIAMSMPVQQATLSLTAEPIPSFQIAMSMPVAQGSLTLTAEPITALSRGINFAVAQASLSLTAEPITSLQIAMSMPVVQASLTLTAEPVNLTYTPSSPPPPPPPPGTYVMDVATATLSLTAEPVGINAALNMAVAPAYLSLTAAGQGTTAITATVVGSPSNLNFANFGGPGDTLKPKFPFAGVGPIFDSYTMQAGDTVFMKGGGGSLLYGLYSWDGGGLSDGRWTLTRDTRLQTVAQLQTTMVTAGPLGATNAGTSWINSNVGPITFGTTPLSFAQTYPVSFGIAVSIPVATATLSLSAQPVMLVYSNGTIIPYHAVTVRCIDPGRTVRCLDGGRRVRPPI